MVINEQLQKAGPRAGRSFLTQGDFHIAYNRLAGQMSRGFITSERRYAARGHPGQTVAQAVSKNDGHRRVEI